MLCSVDDVDRCHCFTVTAELIVDYIMVSIVFANRRFSWVDDGFIWRH